MSKKEISIQKEGLCVMKDVVEGEVMNLEKVIEKRISKNIKIFSKEELEMLKNNKNILLKIYLLGMLDSYSF